MNDAECAEGCECRAGGEILGKAHRIFSSPLALARRWLLRTSAQAVRGKLSEPPTLLKRAAWKACICAQAWTRRRRQVLNKPERSPGRQARIAQGWAVRRAREERRNGKLLESMCRKLA